VGELYDAIQRALAGIEGNGIGRPEIGRGLRSMTEATWLSKSLALTTYLHNCRRPPGRPDRRACERRRSPYVEQSSE